MPRRSAIATHPLTNTITGNLARVQHNDRSTLHTAHVDAPRSIRNPVVLSEDSDSSVKDSSRISKHDPNNLGFLSSSKYEPRISKRTHDANDLMQSAILPRWLFSFSDEPPITERSPGEEDDEQDNEQDDHHQRPPKVADIKDHARNLLIFKDGPRHKRGNL